MWYNVEENGLNTSLDAISNETGISVKNLNRFMQYDEFKKQKINTKGIHQDSIGFNGITLN